MIVIQVDDEIREFVTRWAPVDTVNGFSNLSKEDLGKATREEYQFTGLYGEAAWYRWRHGAAGLQKLNALKEIKTEVWKTEKKGDGGEDDRIALRDGVERLLDVKTSYQGKYPLERLNLVVPKKEFHEGTVYVAAFIQGHSRKEIEQVAIAGWCLSDDVKLHLWRYDTAKYGVPVPRLTPIESISKYFR